jgi:hypothetical protein
VSAFLRKTRQFDVRRMAERRVHRIWVGMKRTEIGPGARDGDRSERESNDPEDIRSALRELLQDRQAIASLCRTAATHGALQPDSPEARALVLDIAGEFFAGDACGEVSQLVQQIDALVQSRANALRHRSNRSKWLPLDSPSALAVEAEPAGRDDGRDDDELVRRIRELARGDHAVQQLLGLYAQGLTSRRHALKAGMTAWTYRTAKDRLAAYAAAARAELAAQASPLRASATTTFAAPQQAVFLVISGDPGTRPDDALLE